jgi:hypothetical protein
MMDQQHRALTALQAPQPKAQAKQVLLTRGTADSGRRFSCF